MSHVGKAAWISMAPKIEDVMAGEQFETHEVTQLRQALSELHEQVAARHRRAEFTRDGCDDVCVLISRAELQYLEEAIEILTKSAEYEEMCRQIRALSVECGGFGGDAPVA